MMFWLVIFWHYNFVEEIRVYKKLYFEFWVLLFCWVTGVWNDHLLWGWAASGQSGDPEGKLPSHSASRQPFWFSVSEQFSVNCMTCSTLGCKLSCMLDGFAQLLANVSIPSTFKIGWTKGNQPWIFTRGTDAEAEAPVLWPPDAKSRLIGKDPDAGKGWRQEEKGMTEDEMFGWHHQLNGHDFEQAPEDGEGERSLVCCSPWGCNVLDTTERLNKNKKARGFPGGSVVKKPPANAGDAGPVPGSGESSGGGNGNPLESSCPGNFIDRGAWQAAVHGLTKSWTQLSD